MAKRTAQKSTGYNRPDPAPVDNSGFVTGPVRPNPFVTQPKDVSYGMQVDATDPNKRLVTTPLGNIQYTNPSAERPAEVQALLDRYKTLSEQGYSAPEYAAARAQQAQMINAQGQSAQRALLAAQAKQGVRGGAAVAQQTRAAQQLAAQRSALEQNLMLENIKNRQQNLAQYGAGLGGALTREQQIQDANTKRDIAAQVTGLGGAAFQQQMGLAQQELTQGGQYNKDYMDWLKEQTLSG